MKIICLNYLHHLLIFVLFCLQIAALGFQGNGGEGGSHHVTAEAIKNTLESLENPLQRVRFENYMETVLGEVRVLTTELHLLWIAFMNS